VSHLFVDCLCIFAYDLFIHLFFYLVFTHLFDFICLSAYFINCFIDFTRILPTNGHNHAEKSFTNWGLPLPPRSNCDFTGYLALQNAPVPAAEP